MFQRILLFLTFLYLTICTVHASEFDSFSIHNGNQSEYLGAYTQVYEDSNNDLRIQEAMQKQFVPQEKRVLYLGKAYHTRWIKTNLTNTSSEDSIYYYTIDYPLIDYLTFYLVKNGTVVDSVVTGTYTPLSERELEYQSFCFKIPIKKGETATVFTKMRTNKTLSCPIYIGDFKASYSYQADRKQFFFLYIGLIAAVFFINLFIYFSTREWLYLHYCFFVGSIALAQIITFGYDQYLISASKDSFWTLYNLQLMVTISEFGGVSFGMLFLQTKKVFKKGYYISYWFYFIATIDILICIYGDGLLANKIIDINNGISALYLLIIPFFSVRAKIPGAKYFWVATAVLYVGCFIYVMQDVGVIERNLFSTIVMPIGSALEAVLISFALGSRLRDLLSDKAKLQQQIIVTLEEKNNQLQKVKGLKYQMNELRHKVLLNQLNPHFLFNALNSINNFMLKNDRLEASRYLSKFSVLMRNILDSSKYNFISLDKEVKLLESYLELEKLRAWHGFTFELKLDEAISPTEVMVPTTMLQPIVENAILHGVKSRQDGKGKVAISFTKFEDYLIIVVEDNGIGYDKRIKETKRIYEESTLSIIERKIKLANEGEGVENGFKVIDRKSINPDEQGTRIEIRVAIREHSEDFDHLNDSPLNFE